MQIDICNQEKMHYRDLKFVKVLLSMELELEFGLNTSANFNLIFFLCFTVTVAF